MIRGLSVEIQRKIDIQETRKSSGPKHQVKNLGLAWFSTVAKGITDNYGISSFSTLNWEIDRRF